MHLEKEEKEKESKDPRYMVERMINKREHLAKMTIEGDKKKEKINKVKMNFKREIRRIDVEDFIENKCMNSQIKDSLMKMNSIQDHFESKGMRKTQMVSDREKKSILRKQLKSRNLLKYMNTDNKEINIELEVQMNNTKIRVRSWL